MLHLYDHNLMRVSVPLVTWQLQKILVLHIANVLDEKLLYFFFLNEYIKFLLIAHIYRCSNEGRNNGSYQINDVLSPGNIGKV